MAVNVRVELRQKNFNPSYDERETDFRKMLAAFRKQCSDCGIQHSYKQHESFESRSRKRRRKRRESEVARLKNQLKENLPQTKPTTKHQGPKDQRKKSV